MRALRSLADPYLLALAATVVLASVLPVRGDAAAIARIVTDAGIALLFFLYGARLPREAIVGGLAHWRLHLTVLACTFVLFPLLGLALLPAARPWLTPELGLGVLFLCALPSTVQSSIAFTSIARGNVAAAVCSASLSNLLGVFLTPLLVSLMMATHGSAAAPLDAVGKIALQLFAPFILGHALRPWLAATLERHRRLLSLTDRGTVLLVVYVAFSASVVEGLWRRVPSTALGAVAVVAAVLLALVLAATRLAGRLFGFARADTIALVFCGSKKSLASGVPIANVLFAGDPMIGVILLPIMLFHPLQLVACAVLARHWSRQADAAPGATAAREDAPAEGPRG